MAPVIALMKIVAGMYSPTAAIQVGGQPVRFRVLLMHRRTVIAMVIRNHCWRLILQSPKISFSAAKSGALRLRQSL